MKQQATVVADFVAVILALYRGWGLEAALRVATERVLVFRIRGGRQVAEENLIESVMFFALDGAPVAKSRAASKLPCACLNDWRHRLWLTGAGKSG